MADSLESDIDSITDKLKKVQITKKVNNYINKRETEEDSQPFQPFIVNEWIHMEANNSETINGNYIQDWDSTDHIENTTEVNSNEGTSETRLDDEGGGEEKEEDKSTSNVVEVNIEVTNENNEQDVDDKEPDVNSYFNIQPIPTLEDLANSDYLHNRQLAARKILEFLQQAGNDEKDLQTIISVMCKLSEDEEAMVQYELMQNIPAIASYCQSEPHLRIIIRQQLMPYTVKLLNDVQVIIRKSGQSALLILLERNLIDQSQLLEWICPLVAQLVLCETNLEELRVEDVSLMNKMIPMVGRETTLKFFLDPFVTLCCDPAFSIRKVCALGFGTISRNVGMDITELSLLPAFLNLCNDEIWHVRKACADVFVDVANTVSTKTRKEILSHIFVNLLTDSHNSVKYSAYQNLGTFIYTFADPSRTGCFLENGKLIVNNVCPNCECTNLIENETLDVQLISSKQCSKKSETVEYDHADLVLCDPSINQLSKSDPQITGSLTTEQFPPEVKSATQSFNNFQFWREPLPEVELDLDVEDEKSINISFPTVLEVENSTSSEISVQSPQDNQESSYSCSYSKSNEVSKLLVQTACINTISTSQDTLSLYDSTGIKWPPESSLDYKAPSTDVEEETNKEVKIKDYSTLSPYDQDIVPPILLFSFISVVNNHPYEVNKAYEDDKLGFIAYSFPAVAFTLGRKYWPCIKKVYENLARNMKWTVRRTIASSLHELALILGYNIVMSDLLPIFLDLFKDVDEVRLRLVQHLSEFLKHLSLKDRKQFLPLFEEFTKVDNDKNWRFRCAVAEQLIKTVELYDSAEIPEYFLPVASSLLRDRVSAVRLAAVELMAVLLKYMHQDPRTENCFEKTLKDFDQLYRQAHKKWIWRQLYIKLCEQFILKETMGMPEFIERIVPQLFSLAWDEVPNVRLTLIRCLYATLLPKDFVKHITSSTSHELLIKILNSLRLDVDKDVRYLAEQFWSKYLETVNLFNKDSDSEEVCLKKNYYFFCT